MASEFNSVLATLHRMHRQFSDLMEQVNGELRKIRGMEERLVTLKKLQDAAFRQVLDQRILLDQKQAQLETNEGSIARRKKQLDEAKNDREFKGISDQIAAAEAANAVLSDEILEGLDYLDTLKSKAEEAKENFQSMESVLADTRARTQEVREWAEGEIRRIKVDFREMENRLDGEHKMMYQRLFTIKKFDMLASLKGQFCSGCHTQIPVDQVASVLEGRRAVACPLCGRMLYAPENHHLD